MGSADNTGSNVNFAAANMKHVNALAVVNLNSKTVPQTYYYDGNTGNASSVRAASTTTATVWPSVNFSSTVPYNLSNTSSLKKYLAIVKPSTATTISATATNGCEAWSLSYNISKNTSSSQSVTSSRPGYYLGWVYSYTGASQTFSAPEVATYKVECWGAQGGGNSSYSGGNGGYASGNLTLSTSRQLYIYVGQQGESFDTKTVTTSYWYSSGDGGINFENCGISNTVIYNNGGYAVQIRGMWNYPGGGSTDIRVTNGNWNDFNSLKSRIMVASSGGGAITYFYSFSGVAAGTINGKNGIQNGEDGITAQAGTQNKKGNDGTGRHMNSNSNLGFGVVQYVKISMGGSGNGYYCGGLGNHGYSTTGTGATGSSFISGYPGCNAISENSTENNIVHTGQPNHYSGYVFSNAVMKAGNESMPSPSGGTETGHSGNGCAIITQVSY